MKVGILTFHEVFNPGAFFQALGSQELVKSMGHEPLVVNYTPPLYRYSARRRVQRASYRLPFRGMGIFKEWKKSQAFIRDRDMYMRLTDSCDNHEDVYALTFDAVLVGADIVWNFSIPALGNDPVYFGKYLNTERLISFAPSVGQCDIEGDLPEYVVKGLDRFHAISVRDLATQRLVERVLDQSPPILCDPAYHLNPPSLLELHGKSVAEERPYLLVYLMGHFCDKAFVAQVKAFARKRKLRIISTLYPNSWADDDRTAHGPLEWLQLIANAEYVITNTFHGTVFSIMLKKRFATQFTPLIQSKTHGMLKSLQLDNRVIDEANTIEQILENDYPLEVVAAKIEAWKEDARRFLEHSLEGSA